ncbi:MAG: lipase family protein [Bacilli bacterium]|nr:lipase family protein [Bacilli bacterium]
MRIKWLLLIPFLLPLTSCKPKQTTFTITWLNANGDVLEVDKKVREGRMPSYDGSIPILKPIKGTSYFFSGWDSPFEPVTKDKTYTATYSTKPNYEVKWVNKDGKVLRFREDDHYVVTGNKPAFDLHFPQLEPSGSTYYAFDGWEDNRGVSGEHPITYDTTYTAQYHETNATSDYDCDGLLDYLDPDWDSTSNHVYYEYEKTDTGQLDFDIDYYNYFIKQDPNVYSQGIAKLTAALCIDEFRTGHISFPNEPSDFDDKEYIYKHLGCEDIEHFFINPDDYSYDKNDLGGATMAHHTVKANTIGSHTDVTKDYNIFFLTFDASHENNIPLWESNLDVGSEDPSYKTLTGEHPEWTDTDYHKGFYIAANRVKQHVDNYLVKFSNLENKILVMTGHSHGAVIANYIAKQYQYNAKYSKIFAYTFGGPTYYFGNNETNVPYIFNILNNDDIITHLPFSYFGCKQYGNDIRLSIVDDYQFEYFKLTGHEYDCFSNIEDFMNVNVQPIIPTRTSIYKIDESAERCIGYTYHSFLSSSVDEKYQECLELLKQYGIDGADKNSPYRLYKDDAAQTVTGINCPYAVYLVIFNVLESGKVDIDALFHLLDIFTNYYDIVSAMQTKLGLDLENPDPKSNYPHRMTSYYLLASLYQPTK